jgi:hypothetical protein
MNPFFLFSIRLFIPAILLFTAGCKKDNQFLYRESGTWEIESMQLDYLNASGGTDSTVSSDITGFFMFYNTPTTGDDPYYLSSNGITVKGSEAHHAHFYRSDGKIITMVSSIGQTTPERSYTIADHSRNEMTIDFKGAANGFYGNYSGDVKEHIVLKRIKF